MLKIDHVGKLFTDTYRIAMHTHDIWEAVYYSAGQGSVQVGEELTGFETGDVFILPPGVRHSDWADEGFQDIFFTFGRCELSDERYYRFKDNGSRAVFHLLNQMYEAYIQVDLKNRENILNLSYELFFQYAYELSETAPNNFYVESIRSAVINNLSDPDFSVNAAIERLHLNTNYARDLFVKNVGCTPLQFLTEKRLEYAKQLLASCALKSYSIREIAYMCGFSDPYYFSRTFRKRMGVSPRDWINGSSRPPSG